MGVVEVILRQIQLNLCLTSKRIMSGQGSCQKLKELVYFALVEPLTGTSYT